MEKRERERARGREKEREGEILKQCHGCTPGCGTLMKTVTDAGEMRPVAMTMWSVKFPYRFENGHLSLTRSLSSHFYPKHPHQLQKRSNTVISLDPEYTTLFLCFVFIDSESEKERSGYNDVCQPLCHGTNTYPGFLSTLLSHLITVHY